MDGIAGCPNYRAVLQNATNQAVIETHNGLCVIYVFGITFYESKQSKSFQNNALHMQNKIQFSVEDHSQVIYGFYCFNEVVVDSLSYSGWILEPVETYQFAFGDVDVQMVGGAPRDKVI